MPKKTDGAGPSSVSRASGRRGMDQGTASSCEKIKVFLLLFLQKKKTLSSSARTTYIFR
jgi:hypothetical protein